VLAVGLAGALGGCGGDGITLPSERPSISLPTQLPTASLPTDGSTPTVVPPEPTEESPTPEPTLTPEPTETAQPTQEPTQEPTPEPTQEPTQEPSPSESPTGEAAPDAAEEDDEGISPWWLVLLGLVLLGAIVWALLARSARRRREEQELLDRLDARGRWAVDHGVGALIGAIDPAATQQAWSGLNATLVDMAADVRTLAQQTPADQGAAVIGLRDAVAALQGSAESHARARLSGDPSPATAEAVFVARDRLSQALTAFHTPPSTGG